MSNKIVAYNSGSATIYGTKYGNHEVGTASNDYRANTGGLKWYNSPSYGNDYLMISNTYDLGFTTQGNAKPVFWVATNDSDFLDIVNKLHDNHGTPPLGTVTDAINWVNASNKYYLINQFKHDDTYVSYIDNNSIKNKKFIGIINSNMILPSITIINDNENKIDIISGISRNKRIVGLCWS